VWYNKYGFKFRIKSTDAGADFSFPYLNRTSGLENRWMERCMDKIFDISQSIIELIML